MGRHQALKRNQADEQAALQWVFAILGEPAPQGDFEAILKDGNVLCRFMQKIRPELITKYKPSEQGAKQRENISLFNKACEQMGVPETDLFQTIDLFEGKDPAAVANTLSRLGGILQKTRPDLPPHGPKLSEQQERQFTTEQLAPGKMFY
ncbi:muscle-specific protein 20-like [Paramacrobiotus metropolitanus]|uniref:muscle-specific protein 20-like n=1 Tax=Paramacrobiotus metropolitanus TaxID=2943436 RepID=UPI002445ACEC|nr:muscle-specific protein 20-like [Paramacrobiotus metropolitanus]